MDITTLTFDELYSEIVDLAQEQGVNNQERWDELVDEVIESHLDLGELDPDQDIEGWKESLSLKYADYKRQMKEEDLEGVEENQEILKEETDGLGQTKDETLDEGV